MKKIDYKPKTNPITSPIGPESWCGSYGYPFKKKFRYFMEISFEGARPIHFSAVSCLPSAQLVSFIQKELCQYNRRSSVTLLDTIEYCLDNHRHWHELYGLDEVIAYIDHIFPKRYVVDVPPMLVDRCFTRTFLSQKDAEEYRKSICDKIVVITEL